MKTMMTVMMLTALGGFVSSASATKIENFDTAASAAANGWVVVPSGDGQTVGWINTDDAGGVAGEAQYDVSRGASTWYADTNLGQTINGNSPFFISGKLNLLSFGDPDLGIPPIIGFFNSSGTTGIENSSATYLGIMLRGEGGLNWGLRYINAGGFAMSDSGGGPAYSIGINTERTFSLSYDPSVGPNGTISAEVSGAGSPIAYALTAGERATLNAAAFNSAGLVKPPSGFDAGSNIHLRLDDLNYTGVAIPEPSTIALILICVSGRLWVFEIGRTSRAITHVPMMPGTN